MSRRLIKAGLAIVTLLAALSASAAAQEEGATISLELLDSNGTPVTSTTFHMGEPIRAVVTVSNPTSRTLEAIPLPTPTHEEAIDETTTVLVEKPALPFEVLAFEILKTPDPTPLPPMLSDEAEGMALTTEDLVTLAPSESAQQTYRLEALYTFPPFDQAVGSYTVHAQWGELTSNSVVFTITLPPE